MDKVIYDLRDLIIDFTPRLKTFKEEEFSLRPAPGKWSKKEIIGHLIDSAHNNLRRFICSQYEATPPKIVYHQDFWVNASQYQHMPGQSVIELWQLINTQILSVLQSMPEEKYTSLCETNELHTLEWLATDYVRHTKHHLKQVFPELLE